jgi:hypothetical protein
MNDSIFSNEINSDHNSINYDTDTNTDIDINDKPKKNKNSIMDNSLIQSIFNINMLNSNNKMFILGFGILVSIFISFLMDIVELITYLILPIIENLSFLSNKNNDNMINILLAKNIIGNLFYVMINIPLMSSFIKYTFLIRIILFVFYIGSDINLSTIPFVNIDGTILNLIVNYAKNNKEGINTLNKKIKNNIEMFANKTITKNNFTDFIKSMINDSDSKELLKEILQQNNKIELFKYLNKYKLKIINNIILNDHENIKKILSKILKRLL